MYVLFIGNSMGYFEVAVKILQLSEVHFLI